MHKQKMRAIRAVSTGFILLGMTLAIPQANAADCTLKISMGSLKILDPIVTTAGQTKYHADLVYDYLFRLDSNNQPQPMMIDSWSVSDDGLNYSFTLRSGITFHNGDPVTSRDVVASLERWGKKDGSGQLIFQRTKEFKAVDETTFVWNLNEPFGILINVLAKPNALAPIITTYEMAQTSPEEAMAEVIGSGPYRFVKEEWIPDGLTVYEKFEEYAARSEPADMFAGDRTAQCDRIEAPYIADIQTQMSAVQSGEIDFTINTQYDLLPILDADPNVVTMGYDDTGLTGVIRINWLHPPFDNVKGREAVQWLVNQEETLHAIAGNSKYYYKCGSMFGCGHGNASELNSDAIMGFDLEKAKQLFDEAGYDGRTLVILQRSDHPREKFACQIIGDNLRKIGAKVDLQLMDWGTVTQRRIIKDAPEDGGWNLFCTASPGIGQSDPLFILNSAACDDAWYGWPCDEEYESYRQAYISAPSAAAARELIDKMQVRSMDIVQAINYGTLKANVAFSAKLKGVQAARGGYPFWAISK